MDLFLEIAGFTIGVLYLWWEYNANPKMWIASVIMPAISMWIYFSKGLYADFSINIYYLAIAVYGYIVWTHKAHGNKSPDKPANGRPVTHINLLTAAVCAVAFGVIWFALYECLTRFTDSTVPVADAFTTALSIVGMWLLARKYAEQWIAWIIVDAVCVWLYAYKGIFFYSTLYGIYTVVAFMGYRKWNRMAAQR